jgi:hypothetical protein
MNLKNVKILTLAFVILSLFTISVYADFCTNEDFEKTNKQGFWINEQGNICTCEINKNVESLSDSNYLKICDFNKINYQQRINTRYGQNYKEEFDNENSKSKLIKCVETLVNSNIEEDVAKKICAYKFALLESKSNSEDNDIKKDTKDKENNNQIPETRESIHSKFINANNNECNQNLKEINEEIKNKSKELREAYLDLKKEINNEKQEINNLIIDYKRCVFSSNIVDDVEPTTREDNSRMSGNIMYANMTKSVNNIKEKIQNITGQTSSTKRVIIEEEDNCFQDLIYLLNDFELVYGNNIQNWKADISSIQENSNSYEDCNKELEILNSRIEDFSNNISKINKFKEKYKVKLEEVENLIDKRNDILNKCYSVSVSISECKVPKELYQEEKRTLEEIENVKEKMQELNQEENQIDTININKEYNRLYRRLLNIRKKIQLTQNSCKKTNTQINNYKDLCEEKKDILNKISDLKEKIVESDNKKEIIDLETKIKYLEKKLDEVVCINVDELNKKPILENTDKEIRINKENKNIQECIKVLVNSDVNTEFAKKICDSKFNEQTRISSENINKLKDQIQEKEKIIKNLNNKMYSVKKEFSNKNKQKNKDQLFIENKSDIKEHTLAVIDKIIDSKKLLIEEIEISDLNKLKKEEYIDNINNIISEFNYIKEEIEISEDSNKLKELIIQARNKDKEFKVKHLFLKYELNSRKLLNITDKYFKGSNKDVEELKLKLKNSLDNLNINNIDKNKLIELNKEYNTLKNKIKTIANKNNFEVNK